MSLLFPLRSAFLALPLEGEAKEHFQDVQKRLQPFKELFRFQEADRPHLTLFFWGSLMEIEYSALIKQTEKIAARTSPFTLFVTGANTFEGDKEPKVLFLTIERSAELSTLKKICPWPNLRPFFPHITLARMKNPQAYLVHRKDILKTLKEVSFPVTCDKLRLYAEVEGVKQEKVRDFAFGSSALTPGPSPIEGHFPR